MSAVTRPTPRPPRPYAFPGTVAHRLPNGMEVISVPLHRLPAATVLFTADAGSEYDPPNTAGVGALAAQALGEGTTAHSAAELAAAFERLGGELLSDAGWTHAECGTTVMRGRVPETLERLAEVVRTPSFPDDGVHRLQQERLADLLQQRAEPRGLADDLFAECCFAAGDRYGLPSAGSELTVRACTVERVKAEYAERYAPRSSLLIVSGDVAPDDVMRLAEAAFGTWDDRVTPARSAVDVVPRHERTLYLGHRADAPQSEIRIGHASVPRTHADFYALTVMNAILGGLFNSRINMNLREQRAYTYGAFTSFDWRRNGSVFEASTAVKSDVTAEAVTEILQEIRRMREEPVRPDELSLATEYLTGVFPLRFETTAAIADAIAFRQYFGLSPTYYDEYRERIGAVTAYDVQRVADAHLRPERLQVVVVGDAATVRAPLEALGLGAIRGVDAA